jgi:hypothetical protein
MIRPYSVEECRGESSFVQRCCSGDESAISAQLLSDTGRLGRFCGVSPLGGRPSTSPPFDTKDAGRLFAERSRSAPFPAFKPQALRLRSGLDCSAHLRARSVDSAQEPPFDYAQGTGATTLMARCLSPRRVRCSTPLRGQNTRSLSESPRATAVPFRQRLAQRGLRLGCAGHLQI